MENTISNKKVIMVHSYKGGTGKTAIAVNLARFLSLKLKKKVLLIEQDIGGSTFKNIFKLQPELYWNDFYLGQKPLNELIISFNDFDVICAKEQEISIPEGYGQSLKTFYALQMERFKREIRYLKEKYDFIILDTRPGYNIDLISSIVSSEIIILLSRLDNDNIENTIEMYTNIYSQFKSKEIVIVQNQVPYPTKKSSQIDLELDLDIIQTKKIWEEFIQDKKLISIPLENDIAYPLSNSKILPFENIMIKYIEEIANLIKNL
ncbi:MAG: AAA family ATPase [Candidatus Hodarchaeales archaeon]|jgi:MinD-like ATPase involved in chromosome partitioning or flagellar assembly